MKFIFSLAALAILGASRKLNSGVRFLDDHNLLQLATDDKKIPVKQMLSKSNIFGYAEFDNLIKAALKKTGPGENTYENLIKSISEDYQGIVQYKQQVGEPMLEVDGRNFFLE